ncbi:MAG: FtsX-like permease family protein [Verrucomicrobiae bacterium]|nr:FtsX-like permease family protein [Verrucomicrobiae bacterium]
MKNRKVNPSFLKLVFNNLFFYRGANLWMFTAVSIASMVISGALFVGDSIKITLKKRAEERLGWVASAMSSSDRWFTIGLESRFRTNLQKHFPSSQIKTAYGVKLEGSVAKPDETGRANRVNIYGVTEEFWEESSRELFKTLPPKHVLLNRTLADQLKIKAGEEIILRVKKPSVISFELPVSLQEDVYAGMRLKVHGIVSGKEMGNFSLRANQLPPHNLFIRYEDISRTIDKIGRANILLCNLDSGPESAAHFARILTDSLLVDDCGIELWMPHKGIVELRSEKVFIEEHLWQKTMNLVSSDRWKNVFDANITQILTYLVNLFAFNGKQTPYSIITAADAPLVDSTVSENEILINQWLAEDLGAKQGDVIRLQYYLPDSGGKLAEVTNEFRVAKILPHDLPWFDKTLLPNIPGLAKAESTQEWNLGFPLIHKFRKKDDDYWRNYRGTPKAFITLAAGKKMWANRFGEITAIRFKVKNDGIDELLLREFATALVRECGAEKFGFIFEPIRMNSIEAVQKSQDFGGLFIGFSFFLVVSALFLVALLFGLNIERRFREFGTYLAVGFTHKDIAKLIFYEAFAIVIAGAFVGGIAGALYSKLMLHFLSTIWRDAVGAMEWSFYANPLSYFIGSCGAVLCSFLAIFGTSRQLKNRTIKNIFIQARASNAELESPRETNKTKGMLKTYMPILLIISGILNTSYLIVRNQYTNAEGFFISGILLLSGLIIIFPSILKYLEKKECSFPDLTLIALRSASRNIKRSVLTAGMFACGFFILISVSIFRLEVEKSKKSLSSGTGGFDLVAESSIPVFKDLNTEDGLTHYGMDRTSSGNILFVPFRVKDGDEASCLNLNRAVKPRLLGCDWSLLVNRFSFSMYDRNHKPQSCWELLANITTNKTERGEELVVPAVGDAASLQWALGKKIGETIDFTDEFGRPFKVKIVGGIANSIMQGNLIISDVAFRRLFPSESGYKFFLMDCGGKNIDEIAKKLSRAFSDYGMEIILATQRLSQFNAVQNTYIGAFQILGGLGLLLGSVGVAIILIRNVLERRNELAVMVAIGFNKSSVQNMIILEHMFIVFVGVLAGVIPAMLSITPAIWGENREFSFTFLISLIAVSAALTYVWTVVASKFAMKTRLIDALRIE